MRRMFSSFPTEKVRLIKEDKTVVENIEALVDKSHIFIDDSTIDIEEGDIIVLEHEDEIINNFYGKDEIEKQRRIDILKSILKK